jgi:hypothetical protein
MNPEDRKKICKKIFRFIFTCLLIIYLTLYLSQASGYYEYKTRERVVLTEEQIKKFEQDVADGKDISIESYFNKNENNYSNKTSKLGLDISKELGNIVKKGIDGTFNLLNKLVEE